MKGVWRVLRRGVGGIYIHIESEVVCVRIFVVVESADVVFKKKWLGLYRCALRKHKYLV